MTAQHPYDGALQMFVEEGREIDIRHLQFLRWLVERGKLEHGLAGPSGGALLFQAMGEAPCLDPAA